MSLNPWLASSLILLIIWFVIFLSKPKLRREMFFVSLFTMPLGLTEPLFVPEYWSPPSLLNLASKTGFDIESFIFAFSIGGLSTVIYHFFVKMKYKKMSDKEISKEKKTIHFLSLISPILVFLILSIFINLNPIYSAILSLFAGGILTITCRKDLLKNSLIGAIVFSLFYFLFFLLVDLLYPRFISEVWNFSTISGILIVGIPIEEILFAFGVGIMWSGVYEHFKFYKSIKK